MSKFANIDCGQGTELKTVWTNQFSVLKNRWNYILKDINFKLGQGTINIWHARYGKFDPDICISLGASTPNPTCPEDMIDHTQALGL